MTRNVVALLKDRASAECVFASRHGLGHAVQLKHSVTYQAPRGLITQCTERASACQDTAATFALSLHVETLPAARSAALMEPVASISVTAYATRIGLVISAANSVTRVSH